MAQHWEVEVGREVRIGTKLERWLGGRPRDWGEVTRLLPGRRVLISWAVEGEVVIHDVEEIVEICVGDWSGEVLALIAGRTSGDEGVRVA